VTKKRLFQTVGLGLQLKNFLQKKCYAAVTQLLLN